MRFTETTLAGAFLVDLEPHRDERGFFARSWAVDEFERRGLNSRLVQSNVSWNRRRGTLRGLHFQRSPAAEAKLVRCTTGSIHDVILDLRPLSPSYLRHEGFELSAQNRRALYVPEGLAHGFLTLEDETEVFYQMSDFYSAEHATGVRWDDPAFGIRWPGQVEVISERDRTYPDFAR